MVIKIIRRAIENRRQKKAEDIVEKEKLDSYRENQQMQKAEQAKKEADRLAHLKQYKTAIEEYNKALELYPFEDKVQLFRNQAEFFFKTFYNIAASYSFLNKFKDSIEYFDKALGIGNIDDGNMIKGLMSKGNCYYKAKHLLQAENEEGAYKIRIESEFDAGEETIETFKKIDEKENLLSLAHDCFTKTTELDRNNADAWYKKGHMEFLMEQIKEAMLSFDKVFEIKKDYDNVEGIDLFEDIRGERGIKAKHSKIVDKDIQFKTKTGHLVRNKAEKMIANFIYENNLMFQYNIAVTWADKDDFTATFYVPSLELYLEHFKLNNVKSHEKLMKSKVRQYEKNKKKLVYTTSEDERNLEEALKIRLKPYIVL
jgi:tetratricopeptide (TPR) repeat protein|tara:strand:+ start:498 stop:1607 length:1110 start_codon:yes stop_codon:yes gene_type:complete